MGKVVISYILKVDMMELIKWNNSYSVGFDKIDEQHKQLFTLLNQLYNAMSVGKGREVITKTLDELTDYTKKHFFEEEKLMFVYSYPQYESHKALHTDFVTKIKEMRKKADAGEVRITIELADFLKKWLVDHIIGVDKKYAEYFSQVGVSKK
jgi:hemerythrin-like metal-binding protein